MEEKKIIEKDNDIKKKAFFGTIWKFFERLAAQGVSLIISIVLARILSPTDYGVVSLVSIFFAFANVIISGGLNTALVQKKNATTEDYSTVLHLSVIVSMVVYAILFFTAKPISAIFKEEQLVLIIRIIGLSLPITAIKSVWCAYISSHLQFKKFFFSTLGGTIVSGIVGIIMAIKGFGPWALVAQQMINTTIDTLILICCTRIKVLPRISLKRSKDLFKYGWKILLSSLLNTTYNEITPLIVGIKYNSTNLSFYNKGKSFPATINTISTNTLSSVLFPFLAKFQNDKEKILNYTRKYMQISSLIVFPMMLGLFAISDNFVHIVLTDKWMNASYYIRVFCIATMFDIIAIGNCETIKAIGKSGTFLIMEIIKKSLYFIIIAIFVIVTPSPETLALSALFCTLVQIMVNSIPNKKLINYSFKNQFIDLFPSFFSALIMCFIVYALRQSSELGPMLLVKQVLIGVSSYLLLIMLFGKKRLFSLLSFLKGVFNK